MTSQIYKNINIRLFLLISISFIIASYLTFFHKEYFPPEICYSTAHSFFYKYLDRFLNFNYVYKYPESLASSDSFSFSLVIFSILNYLRFTDCQTLVFMRFISNLMPFLGTSLLSNKILYNAKNEKYFVISILILLAIRISFYIPEFFRISFLNFNYPWLMSSINNSIHLNGMILNLGLIIYRKIH